ncbi:NUDIX domain-containing protein [Patescibacteria group bacterium]|nr:NUDIX domain-containing protein [Patescibacteria group bacterium]
MANEDTYNLGIKALITNQAGQILLLQVNKQELIDENRAYWDIPGGRVKQGENIEQTLAKEVTEETGLRLKSYDYFDSILSNIRIPQHPGDKIGVGLILFIYRCAVMDEKAPITLSREHSQYHWCEPTEAAELLQVKYPDSFTQKIKTN